MDEHAVTDFSSYTAPRKDAAGPRTSVIIVLSGADPVSPERLAERLAAVHDGHGNVIVACSGRPTNLPALQRTADSVEFLLAPPGTSNEDLRELAMRRAPGDIVRLVDGVQRRESVAAEEVTMVAM
jgi:hypothetical protein